MEVFQIRKRFEEIERFELAASCSLLVRFLFVHEHFTFFLLAVRLSVSLKRSVKRIEQGAIISNLIKFSIQLKCLWTYTVWLHSVRLESVQSADHNLSRSLRSGSMSFMFQISPIHFHSVWQKNFLQVFTTAQTDKSVRSSHVIANSVHLWFPKRNQTFQVPCAWMAIHWIDFWSPESGHCSPKIFFLVILVKFLFSSIFIDSNRILLILIESYWLLIVIELFETHCLNDLNMLKWFASNLREISKSPIQPPVNRRSQGVLVEQPFLATVCRKFSACH